MKKINPEDYQELKERCQFLSLVCRRMGLRQTFYFHVDPQAAMAFNNQIPNLGYSNLLNIQGDKHPGLQVCKMIHEFYDLKNIEQFLIHHQFGDDVFKWIKENWDR